MKRAITATIVSSVLLSLLLTGCNVKPAEPRAEKGKVLKLLVVDPENPAEQAAATGVEAARINYLYRLNVLKSYYRKIGNMDKYNWTRDEIDNLDTAQTFTWGGLPEIIPPKGESLENADERLLVEYLLAARKSYLNAVAELADFYDRKSPGSYKARRIHNMQMRLFPERTYMYFFDAEIPPAELKGLEVIPEAEKLYAKALKLHEKGKGILRIFITTDYGKQREALIFFLQLVNRYPHSTKNALAAYYIGEIYKEYFNKNLRAVRWYQRAWQWDQNILRPARFQAAAVWDLRLKEKEKAIECYKLVIKHEQFNMSNVTFAHRRIRELMKK